MWYVVEYADWCDEWVVGLDKKSYIEWAASFNTKEEAQEYADFLNSKEKNND